MPIPRFEGDWTTADITEEMANWQWGKDLTVEWVIMNSRTGRPELLIYEYVADRLPCSNRNCVPFQLTFVQQMSTGIVWCCAVCRRTQGPLAWEDGRLINRKPLEFAEAWAIIRRTGQRPPVGLPKIPGSETLRIINS